MATCVHKTEECSNYQHDLYWEIDYFGNVSSSTDIVSPQLFEIALSDGKNTTNEKFVLLGLITCLKCRFG